jgi:hypothetical protein
LSATLTGRGARFRAPGWRRCHRRRLSLLPGWRSPEQAGWCRWLEIRTRCWRARGPPETPQPAGAGRPRQEQATIWGRCAPSALGADPVSSEAGENCEVGRLP